MNQALLTLALLAQPDCACGQAEARQVVRAAAAAASRHPVGQDLLLAVVLAESRCSRRVGRPRAGGCDVGYAQVHVSNCSSARAAELLEPGVNLNAAARVLARSRAACAGRLAPSSRCRATPWALYNWHSRAWWPAVAARLRRLRETYRRLEAARAAPSS